MAGGRSTATRLRDGLDNFNQLAVRSLLVADCGTVHTKLALIGIVEEHYRLLAEAQVGTTITPPIADIGVGILDAVGRIEQIIGRPLQRGGHLLVPEDADGGGVDGLVVAISAGGPLRLLTTGGGREALSGLLHRSVGGLFIQLDALPAQPPSPDPEGQRLLAQLRALSPHAVVYVGASFGPSRASGSLDETARSLGQWVEHLREIRADATPAQPRSVPVIISGSPDDGARLARALPQHAAIAQQVEMLSPSTLTPLNRAVSALYETEVLRSVPGYNDVRMHTLAAPIATATAFGGAMRYLAQHYQMNVLGVDVGASATSLAGATTQGEYLPADQPYAGVGPGAGFVLRAAGATEIIRWVSTPLDESELRDYVMTRMLRPRILPTTRRELEIEHALAREAIRLTLLAPGSRLSGLSPIDVLLGTGGVLAHAPHPGLAALVLLDAIQPRGITSLALDTAHLATALGSIATVAPTAAAEIAESDAVALVLGSVISLSGATPPGQPALRVVLEFPDGRQQVDDIAMGTIIRLPLRLGERALLSLYPAPTVDIGLGAGQHARASEPIEGGALGLVVDARGRPLALPLAPAERMARLVEWRRALGVED